MTITQKQNLLQYLGYYEGNVDGISGKLTESAVEAFRKDNGNPNMGDELEEVLIGAVFHGKFKSKVTNVPTSGNWWANIKYFRREEFACKCGKCGGFPVDVDRNLVELLDKVRGHYGKPTRVNSGIRCKTHNAKVGGASNSQHLYGTAADIATISGTTPAKMAAYVETLMPHSGGIGIYPWGIHVDTRSVKARWNG